MVSTNCNNSNSNSKSKFMNRSHEVTMRAALVQASWALIRKDRVMHGKYDRLKSGSGGKRAIVAVARTLIKRIRRMLLDNYPYMIWLITAS